MMCRVAIPLLLLAVMCCEGATLVGIMGKQEAVKPKPRGAIPPHQAQPKAGAQGEEEEMHLYTPSSPAPWPPEPVTVVTLDTDTAHVTKGKQFVLHMGTDGLVDETNYDNVKDTYYVALPENRFAVVTQATTAPNATELRTPAKQNLYGTFLDIPGSTYYVNTKDCPRPEGNATSGKVYALKHGSAQFVEAFRWTLPAGYFIWCDSDGEMGPSGFTLSVSANLLFLGVQSVHETDPSQQWTATFNLKTGQSIRVWKNNVFHSDRYFYEASSQRFWAAQGSWNVAELDPVSGAQKWVVTPCDKASGLSERSDLAVDMAGKKMYWVLNCGGAATDPTYLYSVDFDTGKLLKSVRAEPLSGAGRVYGPNYKSG